MSVFRKIKFFIVDGWKSRGEGRSLGDAPTKAMRDSSSRDPGGNTPLDRKAQEAYENSFKND